MRERVACGLLDTSVLVAAESGRALDVDGMPAESVISAITLGELHAGVLAVDDIEMRAQRLRTLDMVADVETLPVDAAVAAAWARLRVHLAKAGRRLNANDLWIAATALAHDLPVVTQDDGFDAVESVAGLTIVRVS